MMQISEFSNRYRSMLIAMHWLILSAKDKAILFLAILEDCMMKIHDPLTRLILCRRVTRTNAIASLPDNAAV
jgi:hypothetical protein